MLLASRTTGSGTRVFGNRFWQFYHGCACYPPHRTVVNSASRRDMISPSRRGKALTDTRRQYSRSDNDKPSLGPQAQSQLTVPPIQLNFEEMSHKASVFCLLILSNHYSCVLVYILLYIQLHIMSSTGAGLSTTDPLPLKNIHSTDPPSNHAKAILFGWKWKVLCYLWTDTDTESCIDSPFIVLLKPSINGLTHDHVFSPRVSPGVALVSILRREHALTLQKANVIWAQRPDQNGLPPIVAKMGFLLWDCMTS